jgi:ABC-type branched-subunit amino acid transport system ATPase component
VGEDPFQLDVPKFEVKPGEVVAVVGRVGAGKSSLIQAILGNMHASRGTIYSGGSIAYVPQVGLPGRVASGVCGSDCGAECCMMWSTQLSAVVIVVCS